MTLFVPTEDTIFCYKSLDQQVQMDLKELEVKNPNMGTIEEMMKRIMDGPPGADIDKSWVEGDDPLVKQLSGGSSLMAMPSSLAQQREFSVKDWLVDDAPDVDGDGTSTGTPKKAPAPEDEAPFDVGMIGKAQSEKELGLHQLVDKMKESIALATEKLQECSGPEAEILVESSPSLKGIKELLQLRVQLLRSCLADDDKDKLVDGKRRSKKEVVEDMASMSMQCLPAHVCPDTKALLTIDDLRTQLAHMGQEATTLIGLTEAVKDFLDHVEPLKSLCQGTKTQTQRFSAAHNSAAKQRSKDKDKAEAAATAAAAGGPKAKPSASTKKKSKGQAAIFDIPADLKHAIDVVNYKSAIADADEDGDFGKILAPIISQGKPALVVNSPWLHEVQQSKLRLHLMVFKAGAQANPQLAESGFIVQPLGAPPDVKRSNGQYLQKRIFGKEAVDISSDSGRKEFDELICSATKEGHETFTTEFAQMGALYCLLQGEVEVVLTDFKKMSEFAALASNARSGLSASADAGKPGMHPGRVLNFLQETIQTEDMLREVSSFGVRFLTCTVPVGGILVVPPAYIRAQRVLEKNGTALTVTLPYISGYCLTRMDKYKFVKDSVEIFQKPPDQNLMWQIMQAVEHALESMNAGQGEARSGRGSGKGKGRVGGAAVASGGGGAGG